MARSRHCGIRPAPAMPAWRTLSWRWSPKGPDRARRRREPARHDSVVRPTRNAAGLARLAVADDRRQPTAHPHGGARLRHFRADFARHGVADAVLISEYRSRRRNWSAGDHHDVAAWLVVDAVTGDGIRDAGVLCARRSGIDPDLA